MLERPELQSVENFNYFSRFNWAANKLVQGNGQFEVANQFVESRISFDVSNLFAQVVPNDAADLVTVSEHLVERSVLLNPFDRGLFANLVNSGQIVRRFPYQRRDVGVLVRTNSVSFFDSCRGVPLKF
ncbi:unannotated protein [freshwater metagenome]|uniref:Unannotated protein n=1 Tax=freshwater metagenome TaxID=449393 RepID=A0A6J7CPS0_9ZZZZ